MSDESEELDYDCALAASLVIVEMLQTSPNATTPELVSFITFACLEAVRESRRRSHPALDPSVN